MGLRFKLARSMMIPWSFSPLVLRPALWLDASDASTLWDSTTGGNLVAADGSVARWEDKSGNGRHATQGTAVSRPQRKTAVQNGRDVVRFDGANDGLGFGDYVSAGGFSAFAVGIPSNVFGGGSPWDSLPFVVAYRGGGINDFSLGLRDNKVSCYAESGSGTEAVAGSVVAGQPMLCFGEANATRVVAGLNGVLGSPVGGSQNGLLIAAIGRDFVYGGRYFAGDISEIIVYPRVLSTFERQSVTQYLLSKWGITP